MDDRSRRLMLALRARGHEDLDDEEKSTLEYLEGLAAATGEDPATIEGAIRAARTAAGPGAGRVCPKCQGPNVSSRNLQYGFWSKCADCGNGWMGFPISAFPNQATSGPALGPYAKPNVAVEGGADPLSLERVRKKAK